MTQKKTHTSITSYFISNITRKTQNCITKAIPRARESVLLLGTFPSGSRYMVTLNVNLSVKV